MQAYLPIKFLLLLACINSQLIPQRLHIVDKNQQRGNYLIRGNLPISDKQFQIKQLKDHLARITGLQSFELTVVSFLNFLTPKQTKNQYIEQKYFERNPSSGEYRNKLILGSLLDPFQFPSTVAKSFQLLSYFVDIDDVDTLITSFHEQIQKGKKKIVFFHCSAGMDRTGYVAGAYKLKYLNYSLKEVLKENSKFGGKRQQMHFNALNGLKWFCFSLKGQQGCGY